MTTYVHVEKVENENLTQDDWNQLSAAVGYISGVGMEGKASKNGSATEDFAAKKMTVHEDLTLQSGVAVNQFSSDATLAGNSDTTVATEKAVKTYADTKANLSGDSAQDFATNNLIVNGSLEVTGTTISKDIEHMQGNVNLGDGDSDLVTIAGTVKTANSSGQLMIGDSTQIQGSLSLQSSLSLQTGVTIDEFSSDSSLAGNSDTAVPTEKAVKTYTDIQLANKVDQTALSTELTSITNQLASKASINGISSQDFAAKDMTISGNLTIGGNLDLTGDFNKVIEEAAVGSLLGNVTLGSDDTNTVEIEGKLVSVHSTGNLVIDSPLQVKTSTTAIDQISTDGTLAGNSDTTVATEKAVKTYADSVQQAAQTYTDGKVTNSVINNTVNSDADLNSLQTVGVYAVGRDNLNLPADIDTASDFNILTVYQHGTDDSGVQILRSADSDGADKCVFTYQRSWHQQDWTGWQQTLYVNNDGKVGIGTSQPTANLEIKGNVLLNSGVAIDEFSTDGALAGNRDTAAPTEKAVKTYADTKANLTGDSSQSFEALQMTSHGDTTVHGALRVNGLTGQGLTNYHYMNNWNVGHYYWGSGNVISIHAQHRIAATEFMAFSDHRIKKDFSPTDSREDLERLNQLELTNYHYIDTVGHSGAQQKKLIAQQVEEVYPEAVTRSEDFIPNIYKPSVTTVYDENVQQLKIVMDVEHNLSAECAVRLITYSGQRDYEILEVIDPYSFTIASDVPLSEVFVFGKKVNDFRHIDYTAISMLGISATQQLSQENQWLREETAQLKQSLETCLERLDALERIV